VPACLLSISEVVTGRANVDTLSTTGEQRRSRRRPCCWSIVEDLDAVRHSGGDTGWAARSEL